MGSGRWRQLSQDRKEDRLIVASVVFINCMVMAGNGNARFCGPTAVLQADQVLWDVKVCRQLVNSYWRHSEGVQAVGE